MTAPALPHTPQDEHDLVARLAPESPILFYRARRLLREWTRDAADRFLVGRVEDGCWTILHGDDGWLAVRTENGAPREITAHGTARAAVAHALGGLLTEAGTGLNMKVFQLAGIIEPGPDDRTDLGPWFLTETGERLRAESESAPRPDPEVPCVALDRLLGRDRGYFALRRESAPERGAFVTVHRAFALAAHRELPDGPGEAAETLPEGRVLDAYGGTDEVFLYELGTPFHERGTWGSADAHPHRFYRLERPLRVYPAFPLEYTIVPRGKRTDRGRGYHLVDSIADLLRDGALSEVPDPREETAS
ncbi:glycohydrolase toxin TNT-related protein [Spirillospora sp. NPDC000708]